MCVCVTNYPRATIKNFTATVFNKTRRTARSLLKSCCFEGNCFLILDSPGLAVNKNQSSSRIPWECWRTTAKQTLLSFQRFPVLLPLSVCVCARAGETPSRRAQRNWDVLFSGMGYCSWKSGPKDHKKLRLSLVHNMWLRFCHCGVNQMSILL